MSHPQSVPLPHPHGEMRRDEREITDPAVIDSLLQASRVMYIALSQDNIPFMVPVFYVWDGKSLYFHSARSGSKMRILQHNNAVCFAISQFDGVIEDALACDFEARHRTVIGLGAAHFVEDKAEKTAILHQLMARFSDKSFTFPDANLSATRVVRIDIASIKGKQHGF